MSWDYRVVRHVAKGETVYAIHEAFYDAAGKVEAITENDIALRDDSAVGLALHLPTYLAALNLPVIDWHTREEVEPPVAWQAADATR